MRKKFSIFNFQFSILTVIIIFSFSILNSQFSISNAKALDSSPSADIKSKLEELKKEIASKAAKLKTEVNRKLKDKAYTGQVKSKSATTLTLATQSGPKIVNINQDTVFENKIKSKQKFSQKNISLEDYIAALGDSDETGVLTAKKVILTIPPSPQLKAYLWGQIVSISDQLITLKNNESKNIAATFPTAPQAKLNDFVILTGNKDKNNIFEADFVYVIPQGGVLKPKKIATPSARRDATIESQRAQVATKSATPNPRPTSR